MKQLLLSETELAPKSTIIDHLMLPLEGVLPEEDRKVVVGSQDDNEPRTVTVVRLTVQEQWSRDAVQIVAGQTNFKVANFDLFLNGQDPESDDPYASFHAGKMQKSEGSRPLLTARPGMRIPKLGQNDDQEDSKKYGMTHQENADFSDFLEQLPGFVKARAVKDKDEVLGKFVDLFLQHAAATPETQQAYEAAVSGGHMPSATPGSKELEDEFKNVR
jgi:hypothetical protein